MGQGEGLAYVPVLGEGRGGAGLCASNGGGEGLAYVLVAYHAILHWPLNLGASVARIRIGANGIV